MIIVLKPDVDASKQEQLTGWLQEAGFGQIRVYGDGKLRPPRPGDQRVYFSCVRE